MIDDRKIPNSIAAVRGVVLTHGNHFVADGRVNDDISAGKLNGRYCYRGTVAEIQSRSYIAIPEHG